MLLQQGGLPRLTVRQLHRLLQAGAVTSQELCTFCYNLAIAGQYEWHLNAFERLVSLDDILEQAHHSDERRRRQADDGASLDVLDGIPVSVKANIAVASQPLTAGSKVLGAAADEQQQAAPPPVGYSADVTQRLLQECGAVLIGVTTQDEFGMGSLGTHTATGNNSCTKNNNNSSGAAKNPLWLLERIGGVRVFSDQDLVQTIQLPRDAILEAHAQTAAAAQDEESQHFAAGGSSCGSAISVAHGSSVISLGSDTGGSVRLPAAWCGITGLKPSYGLLSRHGLVSYASSLDTIGILAPSVECAAVALEQLTTQTTTSNHDSSSSLTQQPARDSTWTRPAEYHLLSSIVVDNEKEASSEEGRLDLDGLTVGIPAAFSVTEAPSAIREAWLQGAQALEQQYGATIQTIDDDQLSSEVMQKALAAYYVLAAAEASSNLARYDGFRYGVEASSASLSLVEEDMSADLSLLEQQYAAARTQGFGTEVVRRVLCGTSVLSSDRFHTYYEAAAKLRAVLTRQMHDTLRNDCHVLLVPTTVFAPPNLATLVVYANDESTTTNQTTMATQMFANDVMTVPISMAGLPAISVPFGKWDDASSPAKTALQLVAPRHAEDTLLRVARALELAAAS